MNRPCRLRICGLSFLLLHLQSAIDAWADLPTRDVQVLVINFDPRVPGESNQLLRDVLGWQNPHELAAGYQQAVSETSDGLVNYEIVGWQDVNAIPVKQDGFSYMPDDYVDRWRNGGQWHSPDTADYMAILNAHVPTSLVNTGLVDEVWMFGGPYFGFFESAMAGPRSFGINGGVYSDYGSSRPIAVMGFNYERSVTEMLHNLGHRSEATLSRFFGGWNIHQPQTLWDQYTANVAQTQNGPYGIGSIHYPANGQADYDYGNLQNVESTAADWLNYPNFTGETEVISSSAWGGDENGYMRYWFSHLPRAEGVHSVTGTLNNWWEYVFDFDNNAFGTPNPPVRGPAGQYYQFISSAEIFWQDARDEAAKMMLGDYVGHLATITDAEEAEFLRSLANGREAWIGASDQATEGQWSWVTGPETGKIFYGPGASGTAFANWNTGEPNGGSGENFVHMLSSGRWNDVSAIYPNNAGFIVEFSVIPGDFNLDTVVDGRDFLLWQSQYGQEASPLVQLSADGNDDGAVDAEDLAIWKLHFGMQLLQPGSFDTVPEPSSSFLMALTVCALLRSEKGKWRKCIVNPDLNDNRRGQASLPVR